MNSYQKYSVIWTRVALELLQEIATGMPARLRGQLARDTAETVWPSDSSRFGEQEEVNYRQEELIDGNHPVYDWPWPEMEHFVTENAASIPDYLQRRKRTCWGERDLDLWRSEVAAQPDIEWLKFVHMNDLRTLQKQYGAGKAKTKLALAGNLLLLDPRPTAIQELVARHRHADLIRVDEEEQNRLKPTAALYRSHLISLCWTRIDAYHIANNSDCAPASRDKKAREELLKTAKEDMEYYQQINPIIYATALLMEFNETFGPDWPDDDVYAGVFSRQTTAINTRKTWSLSQHINFNQEIAANVAFNTKYSLVIRNLCPMCLARNRPPTIVYGCASDLPPYHLGCSCGPLWWDSRFEFEDDPIALTATDTSQLANASAKIVSNMLAGHPPSSQDFMGAIKAWREDQRKTTLWGRFKRFINEDLLR